MCFLSRVMIIERTECCTCSLSISFMEMILCHHLQGGSSTEREREREREREYTLQQSLILFPFTLLFQTTGATIDYFSCLLYIGPSYPMNRTVLVQFLWVNYFLNPYPIPPLDSIILSQCLCRSSGGLLSHNPSPQSLASKEKNSLESTLLEYV